MPPPETTMAVANEVAAAVMKEELTTNVKPMVVEAPAAEGATVSSVAVVPAPPPPEPPAGSGMMAPAGTLEVGAGEEAARVVPATLSTEPDAPTAKTSFDDDDDKAGEGSERKRRRRGWTEEEEKRLREGVAQHGAGQWAKIRDSYGFKSENEGEGRTCVNLKDKWRNLNRPPRPEKPPKAEQAQRPPRKKKPRTPKRKRDSTQPSNTPSPADDDDARPAPPPVWIPAAAAWCKANLVKVDKGKVHVGALRTKFANSAEYFPGRDVFGDDDVEMENVKYDLENPKTEASKKFRSDALEPFVGPEAIRQNCFIGGLNQLGVFGWAVKGEEATPPARAPLKPPTNDDVAAQVAAEAAKLVSEAAAAAADQVVVPATLGADRVGPAATDDPMRLSSLREPPEAPLPQHHPDDETTNNNSDAPPKKRRAKKEFGDANDDDDENQDKHQTRHVNILADPAPALDVAAN